MGANSTRGPHPGERTLQDLEVLDVGIFGVDVELDARHGHVEEDAVVHLAEGGAVVVVCVVSLGDIIFCATAMRGRG